MTIAEKIRSAQRHSCIMKNPNGLTYTITRDRTLIFMNTPYFYDKGDLFYRRTVREWSILSTGYGRYTREPGSNYSATWELTTTSWQVR